MCHKMNAMVMLLLCAAFALAGGTEARAAMEVQPESRMEEPALVIKTADDALSEAARVTELDHLAGVTRSAQFVRILSDDTPFLHKDVTGTLCWMVEFDNVSLVLPSAEKGFTDVYSRTFFVFLDAATGRLLKITSQRPGAKTIPYPEPGVASAERQFRQSSEEYLSFPKERPRMSFLSALDAIVAGGMGSPFLAGEISAVFVLQSTMGSTPRSVWSITLRGIPPRAFHGPGADQIPVWQRNHIRNVIDDATGAWLYATSVPQPDGE